jgi:hypothetical protein
MKINQRLNRKINITALQRQSIIVITLLVTSLLMKIWPRFRNDALEFPWFGYAILIIIFAIPFFRKK